MPGILTLTHGLPGSGKSTWAEEQVRKSPEKSIRVNRDDIRTLRFGEKYHKKAPDRKSEEEVSRIHQQLIKDGLRAGKHVYCDDTNLNVRFIPQLVKLAKDYGAEVRQEYFDVPVKECQRRNAARGAAGGRLVPEHVIDAMASKAYDDKGKMKEFIIGEKGVFAVEHETPGLRLLNEFNAKAEKKNPFRGKAVVFVDIDGSLANNHRDADISFGVPGKRKNFPYFFRSIAKSPVNTQVRDLANRMRDEDDLNLVVLTGRSDGNAAELLSFIERSELKVSRVIAKREGDFRPDSEFKLEQILKLKEEGLIAVHAIDDRPRSINVWNELKVLVSPVDYHEPVDPETGPKEYPEAKVNSFYGSGHCIRCGSALKNGGNIGPKCRTKM